MLYLSLLESTRQWFQSRGEPEPHASHAAAIACSVLMYMNAVTATLFARALFRLNWVNVFANIPLNLVALGALFALHSWLLKRAQATKQPSTNQLSSAIPRVVPLWLIYLVSSVALLFCGTLLVLA